MNREVIIGGFIGGSVMSLFELLNIISVKDPIDIYFFIGMVVAGIIGIIGTVISSAKDIKSAITAGIAAPTLLGGAIKSAPIVTSACISLMGSPVYADSSNIYDCLKNDSSSTFIYKVKEDSLYIKEEPTKVKNQNVIDNFLRGVFGSQFRKQ